MRVHTSVTCRARERLVIPIWNVFACLGIFVALREAKVNHEAGASLITVSHEEIVWLHVSV